MKYVALVAATALLACGVQADPRMQQDNGNSFCHFMHDTVNDDNETFASGLRPKILVQDGVANGYCYARYKLPVSVINHDFKVRLDNNNVPNETCSMTETNGTEYTAATWKSRITVREIYKGMGRNKVPTGWANVTYKLSCEGGQANN